MNQMSTAPKHTYIVFMEVNGRPVATTTVFITSHEAHLLLQEKNLKVGGYTLTINRMVEVGS